MENNGNLNLRTITNYQLSDKMKALLEVLLNPEHRTKSVTDICKIAGCSRPVYYDAMENPAFMAIYEQKTKDLIKQSVGPVINTFVREALRGSFQHGKVILEMAGLYSEKSTLEVTGEVALTASERQAKIADLSSKLIEGVKAKYEVVDESDD